MQTWELTHYERPMTINDERGRAGKNVDHGRASGHWSQRAKITKQWREAFWLLAKEAKVPRLQWIEIEVEQICRDRRMPDAVSGCLGAYKAGQDGIVDAGVIPNDTGEYVKKVTFLAPRTVKGQDSLTLRITGPRQ